MTQIVAISPTSRIQHLNDQLRQSGIGGRTLMSAGIAALSDQDRAAVMIAVARFDAFDERNDPYGEHDCAVLALGDSQFIWKIDYYDAGMGYLSPAPDDPDCTCRVLTIMLAEEY